MADNIEIFEVFLSPMKRLFLRPPHASDVDESAALSEYAQALSGFSKPVLEAGWKSIRDSQTGRYWPPVAVCIKACNACQQAFREQEKSRAPSEPKRGAGRMVDGVWQPLSGCECAQCLAARDKYRAENAWWYEFVTRKYGAGLNEAQRAALARQLVAAE